MIDQLLTYVLSDCIYVLNFKAALQLGFSSALKQITCGAYFAHVYRPNIGVMMLKNRPTFWILYNVGLVIFNSAIFVAIKKLDLIKICGEIEHEGNFDNIGCIGC